MLNSATLGPTGITVRRTNNEYGFHSLRDPQGRIEKIFHVYGQPKPRPGDEVSLPADRKFIRTRIHIPETDAEAVAREI
jgi:hypothetical protein